MTVLPIDLNKGLNDFKWSNDSVLYHVNASVPSKEIFKAVCDEIGRFSQTKGFKYAAGSKKLQFEYQEFKFKLHFASSHYNTAGEWVWLDINAGLYPVRLEKQYKAKKENLEPIIFYNVGWFDEFIPGKPAGSFVVITPLGK